MARLHTDTHPAHDVMSAGFLSFGDRMRACFGAAHPRLLRRWLAGLLRPPLRHGDAAGLSDHQRKDIGLPKRVLPLSTDAATRLEIRSLR